MNITFKPKLVTYILTGIIIVLVGIILYPDCNDQGSIDVNGKCLKKVTQDRGVINLTVTNLEFQASMASIKTQETYKKLIEDIKKLDLKDMELQSTGYNIYEKREWNKDKKKYDSLGYEATLGIEISTSDISKLGEVVKESGKYNDVLASNMNTYISEIKMKEEQEACLAEAVKNAKDKAEKMARAGGAKLGDLIRASENFGYNPSPLYNNFAIAEKVDFSAGAEMMPRAAPEIYTKDATISVDVNASFELK